VARRVRVCASPTAFFTPRLSSRSAVRERFAELARTGGFAPADLDKIVKSMEHQFRLDQPLIPQYLTYMTNVLRLDFGYSLKKYPSTVMDVIAQALPWTLGLLL